MDFAIKARILNPVSEGRLQDIESGIISVKDGKIDYVGEQRKEDSARDLSDMVVTPGFIDTHLHLPQYQFLGQGRGVPLIPWLKKYVFPAEAKFADADLAERVAEAFFGKMLRNGTTTSSVYSSLHVEATDRAFQVADRMGVRAFIGKVMMDRNTEPYLSETTSHALDGSIELYGRWKNHDNGRLQYIFTPRFAPMCTEDLMKELGWMVEQGVSVQTHLSENEDEIKWVKSLFPESRGFQNYTDVYRRMGLLGERVIMGHVIHVDDDEVEMLRESETKVAHCPYSNENLLSGDMDYFRLRDAGIQVGLATDIGGGLSMSMRENAARAISASQMHGRMLSNTEVFYMATMGGAKVLGIENITGSLDAGKEADLVVWKDKKAQEVYVRGNLVYQRAE